MSLVKLQPGYERTDARLTFAKNTTNVSLANLTSAQ